MLSRALVTALALALAAAPARAEPARLLFASGFERGVALGPETPYYQNITGTDAGTGFSWPISILGARESALHPIDHDNHRATFARLETTRGHTGRQTRVLYQEMAYEVGDCCTQIPYEILNIQDGRRDLYLRFWIKLDGASLHKPDMWRSFFEWKSKDYARGAGFRLIAFIYSDADGRPYWTLQGDRDPEHPLWEIANTRLPVPEDRWFLTEFYWHWSPGKNGRVLWRINGQVVADHSGPSTRRGKPIDFIMLAQLYGDSSPKYQWVDDIEIWSDWPSRRAGPLPSRP